MSEEYFKQNIGQKNHSLLKNQSVILDGDDKEPIKTITETRVKDNNGQYATTTQLHYSTAADGRILPTTQFMAKSWTDEKVPPDRYGECINPFGLHEHRVVYIDIDGIITELGNVLCTECAEYQADRIDYAKSWKCLWGLLWNPDIY